MANYKVPCSVEITDGYLNLRSEDAVQLYMSHLDNGTLWEFMSEIFNEKAKSKDDRTQQDILDILKVVASKIENQPPALPSSSAGVTPPALTGKVEAPLTVTVSAPKKKGGLLGNSKAIFGKK